MIVDLNFIKELSRNGVKRIDINYPHIEDLIKETEELFTSTEVVVKTANTTKEYRCYLKIWGVDIYGI